MELQHLLSSDSGLVPVFAKACVLILIDHGLSVPMTAEAADISADTARRTAKWYLNNGLHAAIQDAPRPGPEPVLNECSEVAALAMKCTKAREGAARWSTSVIAKEAL